jgi:alanine racemase
MRRRDFFKKTGLGSLASLVQVAPLKARGQKRDQGPVTRSMDARVEIDPAHLNWNLKQVRTAAGVPVMAVVKANAYGHGLTEVGRLLENEGVSWFMVGKLEEALVLRKTGVRSRILNFGPYSKQDCAEIVRNDVSQSVFSEEARYLQEAALRASRKAGIHIDVDTGMGRTGVPHANALPLVQKLASFSGLRMEGIMTTLTEDREFDLEQLRRFQEVCRQAEVKGIRVGLRHAASSAGILRGPDYCLDMVRPGIMLYGYYPSAETQEEDRLGLRPVLRLTARVIDIRLLLAGESLSYHRAYIAARDMWVATVGTGYSDGYPPQLAGKGLALVRGEARSVIAAVTANHLMVDLGNREDIRIGDEVILLDNRPEEGVTADVLSQLSGVSVYRLLIGLNPLLPKKVMGTEAG